MGAPKSNGVIHFSGKLIDGGLLFILLAAPLAFGSVHALAYQGIQLLTLFIFLLWVIRERVIHSYLQRFTAFANHPFHTLLHRHPFVLPYLVWMGLVLAQMIPLPSELQRMLSKESYEIYSIALGESHLGFHPISLSSYDTWQSFLQMITCSLLFYLVVSYKPFSLSLDTRDSLFNSLLLAIVLVATFEAFYGIFGYLTGNRQIFSLPRTVATKGAAGTYVNPNHFANYLLLAFPLVFSRVAVLMQRLKQIDKDSCSLRIQWVLFTLALAAMLTAVAASHSRMAIFSALVAVFLLGLGFLCFRPTLQVIGFLFLVLSAVTLSSFFLDPGFPTFHREFSSLFHGGPTVRLRIWQDSIELARDFPWLGTGLGTFHLIFPKYSSVPIILRFEHAHNDWLELFTETGAVGFFLIATTALWFLTAYIGRLRRLDSAIRPLGIGILVSLIAFVFHSFAEFNFHIPANVYSFSILFGMSLRLTEAGKQRP